MTHADRDRSEPVWPPHARNAYQQHAEPDEGRAARYATALDLHSFRLASADWQRLALRVMDVADAEVTAMARKAARRILEERREVRRLRVDVQYLRDRLADRRDQAEAAERALADERATVADLRHVLAHVDLAHAIATSNEDNA